MKFLIYTQYFPPELGAAQTRLAALAKELTALGHQVEVVTAMPNYGKGEVFTEYRGRWYVKDEWEGCVIHRFWSYAAQGKGFRRVWNYLSFIITTSIGIFKAERPDWIFVNSGPLFLSVPAWVASRIWGVPFIFNVADLWAKSVDHLAIFENRGLVKWLKKLELWSYAKADVITAVTQGIRETIIHEDHVSEGKVCFLPNGVDTEIFYPREPNQDLVRRLCLEGKWVFTYPGTHGYAHALGVVLEAAKLFAVKDRVHFLFIGSGSEKDALVAKARNENITNVTFIESLPLCELAEHLAISHFGLIHQKNTPLANETRPAKAYPIMAMAKPILFAGFGEGAELIKQSGAGVVIPPENPHLLKKTVLKLIQNEEKILEMGQRGYQLVQNEFTWKALVQSWLHELMPLSRPSTEQPLVSVVMPAYNAEKFIAKAIESVLAQTYPHWELLVVEDGSKDRTVEIVKSYMEKEPRMKLFFGQSKLRPAGARNLAIKKAQGRYVAFLDSDDLWLPHKLETQLNYMIRGGYALTYGRFRHMSESGKRIGRLLPVPQTVTHQRLLLHNIIGTLTVMLDREQVGEVMMKDKGHEDFILWLQLLSQGASNFGIQTDLARYRLVGGSVSHNKLRSARWVWHIYRDVQQLSLSQSAWCFLNYVFRVSYKHSRF